MSTVNQQLQEIAADIVPPEQGEAVEQQEIANSETPEEPETTDNPVIDPEQEIAEETPSVVDIPSLAAAIEVEPEYLYDLEVGMGENQPPVKLGALKDQYMLAQRRVTEMETQLKQANEKVQSIQTQQQGFGQMSQDMLAAAGRMSAIQQQFNETNWTELEAEDQVNAMLTRQKLNDAYQQAQAQYTQLQQQNDQQQGLQKQQLLLDSQQQLLKALPAWVDGNVAKAEWDNMMFTARMVGYTDDDVNNVTDHRTILLLRKAMLYDKLQSQKTDAVGKATAAPKVLRATGHRVVKSDNIQNLIQRAKDSGKKSDQTEALRAIFS